MLNLVFHLPSYAILQHLQNCRMFFLLPILTKFQLHQFDLILTYLKILLYNTSSSYIDIREFRSVKVTFRKIVKKISYFAKHNIDQTYHPFPLLVVYHIYVFWSTQIILSSHQFRIHIWDMEWVRFYRISLLFVGHDHHTSTSCNVGRKLGHVYCKIHIQCSLAQEFDMKPESKTFIYKAMRILVKDDSDYLVSKNQLYSTESLLLTFERKIITGCCKQILIKT